MRMTRLQREECIVQANSVRVAPPPTAGMAGPPHQLLLAEFIHRSANDYAVAYAEICIAQRAATLEGVRDRLETVIDRLLALASIQRLLQPPHEERMELGGKLCELGSHHAQARFAEQGVFVRVRCANIAVDSARGWAMLMIVSELLTNAARHAFDSPGGLVDVMLSRFDGDICCIVGDDGIGMRAGPLRSGAGSTIIAELASHAGIRCTHWTGDFGTRIELRMAIKAPPSDGAIVQKGGK